MAPSLLSTDDDEYYKTNAKKELLYFLDKVSNIYGPTTLFCAEIKYCEELDAPYVYRDDYAEEPPPPILVNLRVGYSLEEYESFLEELSKINYYAGYGFQCLFGRLWLSTQCPLQVAWAERGEYDGSEWWSYRSRPSIPGHLLNKGE